MKRSVKSFVVMLVLVAIVSTTLVACSADTQSSREAANDPELRKAVSDFITAKSKRKESKTMDRALAILEQKDREILTPILGRVKLLARQNDEYAKYLYEIYETIYLSAVPLDVVVVTLTEYKYPSEDMER